MVKDAISEATSEIQPDTQRRSRPPVFGDGAMGMVASYFPNVRSRRGAQFKLYQMNAMNALDHKPEYEWLVSTPDAINANKGRLQATILAELGRIEDRDDLRTVAAQICKLRPKTRDAVAMIRSFRLGREPKGGYTALTDALIRCVNDFLKVHPSTTLQTAMMALEGAQKHIGWSEREERSKQW